MPKDSLSVLCIPSFYQKKKKNTYLAVSGLSLGTRDLVPWSGIKPRPPALGEWSLSHWITRKWKKVKVAQSCLTLCNAMDLYNPWNSSGQNTGVGSFSHLQRIFPTQESNPGLPHCRWIFYQLSHKRSPRILEWISYPFSSDLPDPGIEPGSPVLQADSLPTEISAPMKGVFYCWIISAWRS